MNVLTKETEHLPREDYRELLELTLLFLGETPPRGVHFRVLGAFHHARWMSKLLYILKLNLFKNQFHLTKHDSTACLEFALFVTLLYVRAWITCSCSCDAPGNDLNFVQNLNKYSTINKTVSDAAVTAVRRHLWYLGQELAPLGLFSDSVAVEVKRQMVARLLESESQSDHGERSIKYAGNDDLRHKTLDCFIGPASHLFFKILNLNTDFLSQDVESWPENVSFQEAKKVVQSLKVVNDSAERAIALATNFNLSLTRREEEKQYLYQVLEGHRKQFPNANKSTFMEQLV